MAKVFANVCFWDAFVYFCLYIFNIQYQVYLTRLESKLEKRRNTDKIYVTLAVKTQLKSFFVIYCFLQTVPCESIHTPSFFSCLMLNCFKWLFPPHQSTHHNDKAKTELSQLCKFIKNKKTEISTLHKYSYP